MKVPILLIASFIFTSAFSQDSIAIYSQRILETAEVDFISSYYGQDGDNAAVTGGRGTEELTDIASSIIIAIPLNDDDVLNIDAGVSAYTSASSSNIDPFDGRQDADPFVASSGASAADTWFSLKGAYTHNSSDRNSIWGANISFATEYDYFSLGFGGNYSRLFNQKNTEFSINANVFLDTWNIIYPIEFRPPSISGLEILPTDKRNSYSIGLGFSQILSKKAQGSLSLDLIQQDGLLSTPFQRVYFADFEDVIADNFQLADDIERLPDARFKVAIGGRLNYFINEVFVIRTQYRYYFDDWGITSHTANIEIPIKITDMFTLYPSYRYYNQTKADYFYTNNQALSTEDFYTSDFDLSEYNANQFGMGVTYTDIFTKFKLFGYGLKSVDVLFNQYERNTGLKSSIITVGFKFTAD